MCWAATRQEVGRAVLLDERFVKDIGAWRAWQDGSVPAGWPLAPLVTVRNMTTATGADHRRLRAVVSAAFTARRVRELRPRIEAVAARLLDALPPDGEVDLRERFTHPLPIEVICELLGVPEGRLRQLCTGLFGASASVHGELREALSGFLAAKRARPGDDLTSALAAADALSPAELVDTLLLLIVAGHETTVNLLTSAVRALLDHPAQLVLLRTGAKAWSTAVEECLRWDSPVANFPFRYAVCEVLLAGCVVRAGDAVLLSYASFGRDSQAHGPGADRFDISRSPAPRHLSFGQGPHHCLGAPLARLEAEIALPALFARHPRLALAAEPSPLPSLLFNGPAALRVRPAG